MMQMCWNFLSCSAVLHSGITMVETGRIKLYPSTADSDQRVGRGLDPLLVNSQAIPLEPHTMNWHLTLRRIFRLRILEPLSVSWYLFQLSPSLPIFKNLVYHWIRLTVRLSQTEAEMVRGVARLFKMGKRGGKGKATGANQVSKMAALHKPLYNGVISFWEAQGGLGFWLGGLKPPAPSGYAPGNGVVTAIDKPAGNVYLPVQDGLNFYPTMSYVDIFIFLEENFTLNHRISWQGASPVAYFFFPGLTIKDAKQNFQNVWKYHFMIGLYIYTSIRTKVKWKNVFSSSETWQFLCLYKLYCQYFL